MNITKAYHDAGAHSFAQHYQSVVLVEEASDAVLSEQVTPAPSMLSEISIDNAAETAKQTEKK